MSDEGDVLLRDGGIAHVRPLRPSDRNALHDLVNRATEQSAFFRFSAVGRATAHRHVDHLTGPDCPGHALVAFVRGELVAVAEYVPAGHGGSAEVSLLVDDRLHGRGLGTLLLEHVAVDAAARGVRELVGDVLAADRPVLRLLEDSGLDVTQTVNVPVRP